MKQLFLIRHAKAESEHEDLPDLQRNLTVRGRQDAALIGSVLAGKHPVSPLILTSQAHRAMATTRIIASIWDAPQETIRVEPRIYQAGSNDLMSLLWHIDNGFFVVTIVGHNPGLESLIHLLAGKDALDRLPTGASVHLSIEVNKWRDVKAGSAKVAAIERPKDYRQG